MTTKHPDGPVSIGRERRPVPPRYLWFPRDMLVSPSVGRLLPQAATIDGTVLRVGGRRCDLATASAARVRTVNDTGSAMLAFHPLCPVRWRSRGCRGGRAHGHPRYPGRDQEDRGVNGGLKARHGEPRSAGTRAALAPAASARPGTRAYLPGGLPGAGWRVAGGAAAREEDADVELDEVQPFSTERGLWNSLL